MMFIIGILLFLFGFAMAVAGFIGIISPKLLKDRKTGKIQTRGTWAGGLVMGLVMFGVGSMLMADDDKANQTAADTKAETPQASVGGGLLVISDNPLYRTETIEGDGLEKLTICGKVRGAWHLSGF